MKEREEMHLKSTINESTLSTAGAVPFPNGEGCDARIPLPPITSERIHAYVEIE